MAYLDALIPPDIQDPAVAQQIYPWQRRTGPIAPPVFQSPADWPSPPAATAARPATPQVAPAVNATEAPGAGWSVRGSAPPVAPVAVGPSNVGAPTNAAAAPAAAPMQPVALGPGVATAQATPAQDALNASKAPVLHGWKKALDIAGRVLAPGVEESIPGTPGFWAAYERPPLKAAANEERAYQTAQSEDALRAAQTQKAIFDANPKPEKPEDLNVLYADAVRDAQQNGRDPATDPTVRQLQDAITSIQPDHGPKPIPPFMKHTVQELQVEMATHPGDYPGGYMEGAAGFKNLQKAALALDKREKDAEQQPDRPLHQLIAVPQPDGSSKVVEARSGSVIPKGAQTISEMGKSATPTADEQRRADLSENMNENLSQLEDIVKRRPDLFGPAAGRLTSIRSAVGTSDPDIAAIETIKHQIGMAQLGAHSMRSAQGVEKAAEAILNSFKNEPNAILKSIQDARNSVSTFTRDVQRKGGDAGPRDFGAAGSKADGSTGTLPDGTKVIVKNGRIIANE